MLNYAYIMQLVSAVFL